MHVIFFVEEESAQALLEELVPRLLGDDVSCEYIRFPGKRALLKRLPNRLRAYAHWLPDDHRLVVLVDRDQQDCRELKRKLEAIAGKAELTSRSRARRGRPARLLNCIAIEELEAWYFGDIEALRTAYPKLPKTLGKRQRYRDPDAITGGTWEALERELQNKGYHRGGLAKIKAAREIGAHMDPERNRSASFQHFCTGLQALLGEHG
jgi:hypothetical protein